MEPNKKVLLLSPLGLGEGEESFLAKADDLFPTAQGNDDVVLDITNVERDMKNKRLQKDKIAELISRPEYSGVIVDIGTLKDDKRAQELDEVLSCIPDNIPTLCFSDTQRIAGEFSLPGDVFVFDEFPEQSQAEKGVAQEGLSNFFEAVSQEKAKEVNAPPLTTTHDTAELGVISAAQEIERF